MREEPGTRAVQEEQSWQVKKAMRTRAYRLSHRCHRNVPETPLLLKANSHDDMATVTFVKRDLHSTKR